MEGDFVNETLYSETSAIDETLEYTGGKFIDLYTGIIPENKSKLIIIPRYKDETKELTICFRLIDSQLRNVISEVKCISKQTIVELVPKIVVGRKFDLQYKTYSDANVISITRINHEYKS